MRRSVHCAPGASATSVTPGALGTPSSTNRRGGTIRATGMRTSCTPPPPLGRDVNADGRETGRVDFEASKTMPKMVEVGVVLDGNGPKKARRRARTGTQVAS